MRMKPLSSIQPKFSTKPLLSIKQLSVGYPLARVRGHRTFKTVLSGVDLELVRGELVSLLGPNGAGKSTLLRTLSRLQPPISGQVLLEGEDTLAMDGEVWARKVAIVLTERVAAENLSVTDLVSLGRHPYTGWSGRLQATDLAAIESSLQSAGAWDLRDREFDELSDGEKQRVMLARALAQDPQLLILDEPTAFLDLPRRVELMRTLRKLAREQQRAILISTHDLDLAMRASDRLWLLPPGGPVRSGLPEDLVLQGYIGEVFNQGDVIFETATGHFKIHEHPSRWVRLVGEPDLRLWTTRALEREGIAVGLNSTAISTESPKRELGEIRVTFDASEGKARWEFSKTSDLELKSSGLESQTHIFTSLGELLQFLRI